MREPPERPDRCVCEPSVHTTGHSSNRCGPCTTDECKFNATMNPQQNQPFRPGRWRTVGTIRVTRRHGCRESARSLLRRPFHEDAELETQLALVSDKTSLRTVHRRAVVQIGLAGRDIEPLVGQPTIAFAAAATWSVAAPGKRFWRTARTFSRSIMQVIRHLQMASARAVPNPRGQ